MLLVIMTIDLKGQDPCRFEQEISVFNELLVPTGNNLVVFTGSSSVRMWEYLDKDCDGFPVVNSGFGGSHMSDLLYFLDQTVLRFRPAAIYIYEGDNDISAEKDPEDIMATTQQVVNKILALNPAVKIYFICAKPSPSRWKFKTQYEVFNRLLKNYTEGHSQLFYLDVWNPMLDNQGRPISDIFIADSLHMNRKGYLIWKEVICE